MAVPLRPSVTGSAIPEFLPFKPFAAAKKKEPQKLKKRLACGGTAKDESVILQGDHRDKVVQYLVELGFKLENIVMQ